MGLQLRWTFCLGISVINENTHFELRRSKDKMRVMSQEHFELNVKLIKVLTQSTCNCL